ncbi:DUF7151 family protein [Pyxidicoccus trucidator]|uniref:DUF7151 family protein n=1 Tax=Pyxidicoccus trucidator TaxID=2709662 RepID=UPI0023DDB3F9|nr:collagen-like protein [Pyxidicoccus trucidator]
MRVLSSFCVLGVPVLRATLVVGLLGMTACKGGEGVEGAVGPPGPQGPEGPPGPAGGPPGPQGLNALMLTTPEPAGENCAFGGVKMEAGIDADRDGALRENEVNAANTRYLCNGVAGAVGPQGPQGLVGATGPQGERGETGAAGPMGPQGLRGDIGPEGPRGATGDVGPAGPTGSTGAQGPQGEHGALALYGDGSAGDLTLFSSSPLRNLAIGYGSLPGGANLMFRNVRIDGTLIVASGTVIRATGDIIIGPTGIIAANSEPQVQSVNPPGTGLAISAAGGYQGGRGLDLGRSALLTRFDLRGGGGGFRPMAHPTFISGGEAGGRIILAARGNVTVNGTIEVDGRNARNTGAAGQALAGGGGGGGGVVSIVSRGTITLGSNGFIRANGGNGANGVSGVSGTLYGAGGGGGGGIVQFLTANTPVIANVANIQVAGGAAGTPAVQGTATSLVAGGGGGGSGGDGGEGTFALTNGAAEAGTTGDTNTTVTPQPELLFY